MSVQAVILAGGLGVRLRPLTYEVPKPMVPVAGKPYLEHQFVYLRKQGFRDVVLLIGYLGEQIEKWFGDGSRLGLSIRYSREETPLGTGGAVLRALPLLADRFVIIYGDSYLPIDYSDVLFRMEEAGASGNLVVYDNRDGDTSVRNNICLTDDGFVARYRKDAPEEAGLTHVDAGVAAMRKAALESWDGPEKFSLESGLYTKLIQRRAMLAYPTRQRFYDIGTPERLKAIEEFLAS